MALPDYFKFQIHNNCGSAIEFTTDAANNTLVVTAKPWKRVDGELTHGAEVTLFTDGADLAADAIEESGEYDNSANVYEGMDCYAGLTTDNGAAGSIDIYMEWPTDGAAGVYPSDSGDFDNNVVEDLVQVGQVIFTAADDDRGRNFKI